MTIFTQELADVIWEGLTTASDSQLSLAWRSIAIDFKAQNRTLRDQFDFFVTVVNESCCASSSFIKTLCSVDKYYIRP